MVSNKDGGTGPPGHSEVNQEATWNRTDHICEDQFHETL